MSDEEESEEIRSEKSGVERLSRALVEYLAKEENRHHLIPQYADLEHKKAQANVEKELGHLIKGFLAIEQMLPFLLSDDEWESFNKEVEVAIMNISATPEPTEASALTLHKIMELSDMTLFHFYQVARLQYSRNQFGAASDIFKILVVLDPLVSDFWIAYGLTLQNDHKHLEALHAYAAAILLSDSPAPHVYSAECYLLIEHPEDARVELEEAQALVNRQNVHDQWDALLKRISSRLKQPVE